MKHVNTYYEYLFKEYAADLQENTHAKVWIQ